MKCTDWEDRIARSLDGAEDGAAAQHLETCPSCAAFARGLESDRRALRTPPPELERVDFAAMRRQVRAEIVREKRRSWVPVLAAAAAVLLAVVMGTRHREPHPVTPVPVQTVQVKATDPATALAVPAPVRKRSRPRVSHSVPRPDPLLEAALAEFLRAENQPPPAPLENPPGQIRLVTNDPDVLLVLVQPDSGAPK